MAEATDYGNIIVLTGAGASKALGFPTMVEFPDLFASEGCEELRILADGMRWREQGKDLEYIYDRLELYERAGQCAAEGDETLCSALGGPDAGEALCARARTALSQLDELVLEHLGEVKRRGDSALEDYRDALTRLRELNGSALRVFTTNYDLTLESLLPRNMIVDGFRFSTRIGKLAWSPTEECRDGPAKQETRLVIYRLNGCARWFLDEHTGRIFYLEHLPKHREHFRPVVATPARSKVGEAFRWPFDYAYSALRTAVGSAKVCVVVGYSLRDDGVVDALNQAARDTCFIVVDPRGSYAEIGRRLPSRILRHIKGNWGDASVTRCLLASCQRFLRGEGEDDPDMSVEPSASCDDCGKCREYGLPVPDPTY